MSAATAPPSGWARLSKNIIHDPDWLDCSRDARFVFLTSIALAKSADNEDRIDLRSMVGIQHGVMTADEVQAAADELVGVGLWVETDRPSVYRVRSFLRWNPEQDASANASARQRDASANASARQRRRVGALRTNHKRGFHKQLVEDCPDCSPSQNADERSAHASADASARSAERSDAIQTRPDQTRPDHHPPTPHGSVDAERTLSASADDDGDGDGDGDGSDDQKLSQTDPAVIHLADALMDAVGQIDTPAGEGLRQPVADALNRLWPAGHLRALAAEVGSDPDVKKPVKYLIRCVKNLAAEDPPVPPLDPWDYPTGDDGIQVAPPDVVQAAIRTARANITTGDHP